MPIQFFCPACHQPIEVDDDAANQSVTCPYCRKVVTAPFSSDPSVRLAGSSTARMAGTPAGSETNASAGGLSPLSPEMIYPVHPKGTNVIGWVAFVCAILSIICMASTAFVYGSWIKAEGITTPAELQSRISEIQQSGNAPSAVVAAGGMACMGIVVYLGALVAGIIGVMNKKQPRWPAIVAVILVAGLILVLCGISCLQSAQLNPSSG